MLWTLRNGHRRRECSVQLLPHGLQLHLALNGETALLQPDLAYNLGNLCRRVALPKRIDSWSLTSLQQRLVRTGGRLVKHARRFAVLSVMLGEELNGQSSTMLP